MRLPSWTAIRDGALWLAGMALLTHETLLVPSPRWELLLVATAMLGLPGILRGDFALTSSPGPPPPERSSLPDSPGTP